MKNLNEQTQNGGLQKVDVNLTALGGNLQNEPEKATRRQADLELRLAKLAELNNNLISRWSMSKSSKQLLRIDNQLTQESLRIIRKGENDNLASIAQYQTRYLQTLLHNLVLIGEANITSAAKIHYDNAKEVLHKKLLIKLEDITHTLQEFEERAMDRPEKYRVALVEATDKVLIQWLGDFDRHLNEFSNLLDKTFTV